MNRRDEIREYENDVFYEVWRKGGDPDRIDYERVEDAYWDHEEPQSAAQREMRKQRQASRQQQKPIPPHPRITQQGGD